MPVAIIEIIGDNVICDICDKHWTDDMPGTGGFQFESKAVCPDCKEYMMDLIKQYNEERFIRARQPDNKSFWRWVVEDLRGGEPGTITVVEG